LFAQLSSPAFLHYFFLCLFICLFFFLLKKTADDFISSNDEESAEEEEEVDADGNKVKKPKVKAEKKRYAELTTNVLMPTHSFV